MLYKDCHNTKHTMQPLNFKLSSSSSCKMNFCDGHNRVFSFHSLLALALCVIFLILVSLKNVKKYSNVFEIFSTLRVPFGHPLFEKTSNNVDFSLWGNRALRATTQSTSFDIYKTQVTPKSWKSHIVSPGPQYPQLICPPCFLLLSTYSLHNNKKAWKMLYK